MRIEFLNLGSCLPSGLVWVVGRSQLNGSGQAGVDSRVTRRVGSVDGSVRFWQGILVQRVDLVQRSVKPNDRLLPPRDFPSLLQLFQHLSTFLFPSSSTLDRPTLFTSNGSSLQVYDLVGNFSRGMLGLQQSTCRFPLV